MAADDRRLVNPILPRIKMIDTIKAGEINPTLAKPESGGGSTDAARKPQ